MAESPAGLLPLQIRRQKEELARWRALEARANLRPKEPVKPRARSAGRRPPADADVIAGSPRREASELQALVMERRQLLARQQTPRMREARAGARLSMRLVQEAAARPTETKFLDAVAAEAAAAEESSVPTGAETTTPTAFGRA